MKNFYINTLTNPKGLKKDEYDVIIIGAGIGGLVCGCYLAKAGLKVLIVEKHYKVGGYCTSFERKNFIFQAGAIEDLGNGSVFKKILYNLGINKKIEIKRASPHILLFANDDKIKVGVDNEIFEYLKVKYPKEAKQIEKFYKLISEYNILLLYKKYRKMSFEYLLRGYFKDEGLKNIFRALSSFIGIVPNEVSALSVITYYKTFIIGGGYYPKGGLQKFSNAFLETFKQYNGNIRLSTLVTNIIIKNNKAKGVILSGNERIYGNFIISNADATFTFLKLINKEYLNKKFILKLKKLIPSVSAFIVYLGINRKLKDKFNYTQQIWFIPSQLDNPRKKLRLKNKNFNLNIYCYTPSFIDNSFANENSESIAFGFLTSFINDEFWKKNKLFLAEKTIKKIQKVLSFSNENIQVKEIATPKTLYNYTFNREGACKGWAPLISQTDLLLMPYKTYIENLFLANHWVTSGVGETGIPHTAYIGYRVSQTIYKILKIKNEIL
ncbi:MAG: NAD(P)/FAD-dependent oxidoreductase [Candidatus Omnitrophica bacterium]|nr:NAD(P)/FAD-dependent oxidoreductase [Candidatus Omnitrophota bacterium]